jgi:hypothetical protein
LQALELITVSGFAKQYSARTIADMINRSNQQSVHTEIAKTWTFTERGKRLYLSQKAIRPNQESDTPSKDNFRE